MSQKSYSEGPFAGPPLSPSTGTEDLSQAVDNKDKSSTIRMSSDQFQRLIETRIESAAAHNARSISVSMPVLAESSTTQQPPGGVVEDVFLGAFKELPEPPKGATMKEIICANEVFSESGEMIDTLLSEFSMRLVRSFLNSQPTERQGELCEVMVRDLTADIVARRGCSANVLFDDDPATEGETVRTAMEILVEKDDAVDDVDDVDDVRYRDLMVRLTLFMRKYNIHYS